MSTYRICTEPIGTAVRGGFAMPTFGGTGVSGTALSGIAGSAIADGSRERHLVAVIDAPTFVWADAADVATQPKRNQGTQVWSPPT